jgi:hypothetical protein
MKFSHELDYALYHMGPEGVHGKKPFIGLPVVSRAESSGPGHCVAQTLLPPFELPPF